MEMTSLHYDNLSAINDGPYRTVMSGIIIYNQSIEYNTIILVTDTQIQLSTINIFTIIKGYLLCYISQWTK